MIHSISSSSSSFKDVKFKNGFNAILAERTGDSTDKDSRNGLGKSTLADILHFCLGGRKSGTLNKKNVSGWTFTVKLDIGGAEYSVSRNTANDRRISVEGDFEGWGSLPSTLGGSRHFSVADWTKSLGSHMYGLTHGKDKYAPSFRSLVSYLIRRGSGGYETPFRHYGSKRLWDEQVNSAYLLGLDWTFASRMQNLRDRQRETAAAERSLSGGALSDAVGSQGSLEANRIVLEDEIEKEKNLLKQFKVHDEYRHIEGEASQLAEKIHALLDQNVTDMRLLDLYRDSLVEEADIEPGDITRVYEEAGLLFPDAVAAELEDVRQFHRNVVKNRQDFLGLEITGLEDALQKRREKIDELDEDKSRLMQVLETHGALEEFMQIQENHRTKVAKLEDIKNKLAILKNVRHDKDLILTQTRELKLKMNLDLTEREVQRREAIKTFNYYSQRLYDAPGSLSIDTYDNGYKFDVRIERSGSHGYDKMQIFCYDLMLAKIWSRQERSPGFLVHDSTMFADVDERQVAHALQLASAEADEYGYQYICMLNSDAVPYGEIDKNFDFHVSATFTDATPEGGLLGIRF